MKMIVIVLAFLGFSAQAAEAPEAVRLAVSARQILAGQTAGYEIREECYTPKPKKPKKGAKPVPVKPVCKKKLHFTAALAVKRAGEPMQVIKVNGNTCVSETAGFDTMCYTVKGHTNGVNTEFVIRKPQGYCVYGIRRAIGSNVKYFEAVYTPYNDCLNTPEVRQAGRQYLERVVGQAYTDLAQYKVKSLANGGAFVHDRVPRDFLVKLAIVEHIDEERFQKEDLQALVNEVHVVYGLNQGLAYNYAVSRAKARGIIQIIPSTYAGLRKAYPKAGIEPNFVQGTEDHRNAVKTAALLLDHDVGMIRDPGTRAWLLDPKNKSKRFDYGCSAYNGGPARAIWLLFKGKDFVKDNPNKENRIYVDKCRKVAALHADRS